MKRNVLIKVIAVDVALACLTIVTYGVCGLSFRNSNTLKQAFAITLAFAYLIIFLWFNYKYLIKTQWKVSEINDRSSLYQIVHQYYMGGQGVFDKHIYLTERHIDRFDREKATLQKMLYENFREDRQFTPMSNLMENAEETFTTTVHQIIKRISIFDFKDYAIFSRSNYDTGLSPENFKKKDQQFKEHITYVSDLCNKNEELLLELNNLITEVSRINDSNRENNLSEIQDTVKAMKQLHFSSIDQVNDLTKKYH